MRLLSLSMQNFRQHEATRVSFALGLTGIIGANGSGKSTILEALAFALYGQPAARGKKESIKFLRAQPRASVRVELAFELAGHRYRVVRGLSSAECYLDDASAPIANTLTGVTDLLQRLLGMSREEFFCTYFTGQKELAMMASMSPTDRGKFLQRVLGYDRIGTAQESVRDRRRMLMAELTGLRINMQDGDAIARNVRDASDRLAAAQHEVTRWLGEQAAAAAVKSAIEPAWQDAQVRRQVEHQLTIERQSAALRVTMYQRDIERLTATIAELDRASEEVDRLRASIVDLPALRAQASLMELDAATDATRQNLLGVQQTVQQSIDIATARLDALPAAVDRSLIADRVAQLTRDVTAAEATYDDARDAWTRAAADARASLESLRDQFERLSKQKAQLLAQGEDAPCASCGQRIGQRFESVVLEIVEALELAQAKGLDARARVNALAAAPAEVTVAQAERGSLLALLQAEERALVAADGLNAERSRLEQERQAAEERLATVRQSLGAISTSYDRDAHLALRQRIESLGAIESRISMLVEQVERRDDVVSQLDTAQQAESGAAQLTAILANRLATEGIGAEAFAACQAEYQSASERAHVADAALTSAIAERSRAEESLGHHRSAQDRFAALRERLTTMEHERLLLDEADRGYTDLRATLNASLRPELAEIASELLDTLTDGRYTQADIDESYTLLVLEDGLAKPVLSGGEEDLCNLILRLAISQMIAQRAGHAFSLLILDEVFGALDDARRANVMELLRRLNDRFEQVIVITHINQVRDGLDNILQVRFDAESGASVIVPDVTEEPAALVPERAA